MQATWENGQTTHRQANHKRCNKHAKKDTKDPTKYMLERETNSIESMFEDTNKLDLRLSMQAWI